MTTAVQGPRAPIGDVTDPRFVAARELLATTEAGAPIADLLGDGSVKVEIYDDEEFARRFPGTGGNYQPALRTLRIPEYDLDDPREAAALLAHEGKHALDGGSRFQHVTGVVGRFGGALLDGVGAAVRLRNPLGGAIDGFIDRSNAWEVDAYRTQAQVAHELGLDQSSWALGQRPGGEVRSDDDIRARVEKTSIYSGDPSMRLLLGAGFGATGALAGSIAGRVALRRIAPDSVLARHSWMVTLGALGVAGALVLEDQLRARRG